MSDHLLNVRPILAKALRRGGFGRQILTVLTGTGLAQLITLFSAPVLTRLYAPDQYGIFANVAAICAIAAVLSTGRYESSIMIPTGNAEAFACVKLSLLVSVYISATMAVVVPLWGGGLLTLLRVEIDPRYLFVVPVYTFLSGSYQAIYAWLIRTGLFSAISLSRVGAAVVSVAVTLAVGSQHPKASGLVAGLVAGQICACCFLWHSVGCKTWKAMLGVSQEKILDAAVRFKRFPAYAVPSDLCNSAAQQLPSILLLAHFGAGAAGLFALTQRMLSLPISLLSSSILDVFKKRAADDLAELGNCRRLFLKTMFLLTVVALLPLLVILLGAPLIFGLVFGPQWMQAGVYAQILAPMFFLRFIASPLSYVLYLTERQSLDLLGNIAMLTVSTLGILIGAYYQSVDLGLSLFSGNCCFIYALYILISFRSSSGKQRCIP